MLSPGTKLGPYEIVATLGAGGMGQVYRARDTRLQREVAVKVLPPSLASDAQALRRLEQEARAVAALNHPNLLTIHDFGTQDGVVYLVTELLEGQTLRQRLGAGALAERQAADFGAQIAHGLAAAHDKGIVHRDLKPENIFCTADGRVKILDFGLAKVEASVLAEAQTVEAAATAAGTILGTVGYMAPEQVRGMAADARSDIFSLGCVLYEMLAGARAFGGGSAADVMSAILKEEPPEAATAARPLSPALDKIVRHCLEKEPRQRFQSASDIAFALGNLSVATTSLSGVVAAPPAPRSRRRLLFAAVGTAGLAAAVALTWWLAPGPPPPPKFHRVSYEQGAVRSARFLPDGQGVIAEAAWNNARFGLYTGRLDSPGMQVLAANGIPLAASGGEVALLQQPQSYAYTNYGTLALMPLGGGAPRAVLTRVGLADYAPGRSGAESLAITRYDPATHTFTLEYPIGHVLFRSGGWIGSPRFSRDGTQIAFQDHPVFGDDGGYVAVTDLSGRVRRLTRKFSSTRGLAWSPDGREIWFTAGDTTAMALRAVTLGGRERRLIEAPEPLLLYDVLPDGRALLAADSQRLSASAVTAAEPRPRDLTVLDWANNAVMSADGKQALIGDEDAGPNYGTYLRNMDGSPPVRLGDGDPIALSADGQWAASVLPSTQQIVLLPTGAGGARPLTHGPILYRPSAASFLPGGRGLLVIGNQPGHPQRDYLVAMDGSAHPVTQENVLGTAITPDGRAALAQCAGCPWALYPLAGGAPQPVPALAPDDHVLRFAGDGGSVLVQRLPGAGVAGSEVWRVALASRQRTRLFTVSPAATAGVGFTVVRSISADALSYVIGSVQRLSTLYVVTGLLRH